MTRYLTDLADVLRAAGITVVEVDGWQTRSRSSGGFADGRPTHLMVHHTASPPHTDGQRDVDYIVTNSPVRPVSNLYTSRAGVVYVCAGGATNTNGKGRDTWGGGVPDDQMNVYAIANEIANNGTGEPYPDVQQASVLTSSAALVDHYNLHPPRAHFEWAPTRKIDPSGPSLWAPNGGKWNMDAFRLDVANALAPPPPPPPPPPIIGVPDVFYPIKPFRNYDTRGYGGAGVAPGTAHVVGLNPIFPANTIAVAVNVVAVGAQTPGFVTVWPDAHARPDTSIINYPGDGGAHNGAAVIGVNGGKFRIQTSTTCHLICDITGYWTS